MNCFLRNRGRASTPLSMTALYTQDLPQLPISTLTERHSSTTLQQCHMIVFFQRFNSRKLLDIQEIRTVNAHKLLGVQGLFVMGHGFFLEIKTFFGEYFD